MGRQTTNITSQLGGKFKLKHRPAAWPAYPVIKALTHKQGQEYRNFAFHLSCLATHNVLYGPCRIQTWLSTAGSKDRLWIVTTAAAFPQRLSMEATLRLDWTFNVNHSCVRDKCILNVLLLLQNLRLKEKKRKKRGE